MRRLGVAFAGALAVLGGVAAAAESLGDDREAWTIAARAGVEQAGWRMIYRDSNVAVFVRTQPERPGQHWVAIIVAGKNELKKNLLALNCQIQTVQQLRGTTSDLNGRNSRDTGELPVQAPLPTSANDLVLDHVCGPPSAATSMVPATPPPPDMEVIDSYRASGKRLVMFVGEPVVVRVWAHPSDAHVWRLEPSDGVEQVGTPRLYTAPPSGGAGFNQAYDVVIRAKRTGIFQVAIVNVHKQTGARNDWASPPVRFEVRGVRDGGATPSN